MAKQEMTAKKRILKEGMLQKKSSVLKQWRPRFVVLNRQMLCTFKKEDDEKRGRTAEGRIFVMDIESIENYESKKKKHCFNLIVEGRPHSFCCSSELDRELWMRSVQTAKDNELKEEETDPVRRKSTKLTGGLKRITIQREKGQGLGCTIKNVGGVIFVNRILEDGPVSTSGILRPGDQILDINGIEIDGRSVSEISEIIKASPDIVVCTVKPSSDYRYCDTHEAAGHHTEYAEIDLALLKAKEEKASGVVSNGNNERNSFRPETLEEEKSSSGFDHKRHSLPDTVSKAAAAARNKDDSLNYLELNFPQNERPRGRSDIARSSSPRVPCRRNKEQMQTTPGSYIELEFNSSDKKKQESGNSAKAGDVKSHSLPRH